MAQSNSTRTLAVIFFLSGLWDLFAAVFYAFLLGAAFPADPALHHFYALFIASFLLCFAYLQILSSFNIRHYLLNIGCVTIGRLLYVALLYGYMFGAPGFPRTFWWTAAGDLAWSLLYIIVTLVSPDIRLKDLFIPKRADASLGRN